MGGINVRRSLASMGGIAASLLGANTLLKADADGTPTALTVAEARVIGRLTGGNIAALTAAQIGDLLMGSTLPALAGVRSAGSSSAPARVDHVHPRGEWVAQDSGLLTWAYDSALAGASSILSAAGTVHTIKLHLPEAAYVTNILLHVSTSGSGLTANQCRVGLFQNGTRLGECGDQSAVWNSTGVKTMAIAGGPVQAAAGDVIVGLYANGTTLPTFTRSASSSSLVNVGLAAASSRFGTADTGRTTSLPTTLGTIAAAAASYWCALS